MVGLLFRYRFSGDVALHWSSLGLFDLLPSQNGLQMLAGSLATGGTQMLNLAEGQIATFFASANLPGENFRLSDLAVIWQGSDIRYVTTSFSTAGIWAEAFRNNGTLRPASLMVGGNTSDFGTSALESFHFAGQSWLVTASQGEERLRLYRIHADWSIIQTDTVTGGAKTTLSNVSDIKAVMVADNCFLVAASDTTGGITVYQADPHGNLGLTDSLTSKDGLWVSGIDQIATLDQWGKTWLIAASGQASTLAVVRLNALGVMFISDLSFDSDATRIRHVSQIAAFSTSDHGFVLAAGDDGGISLFELLPDGTLFHRQSWEAAAEWGFTSTAGLKVVLVGQELQVFLGAGDAPALIQFSLDLAGITAPQLGSATAETLLGGNHDDFLWGGGGADLLSAGAGDDLLFADGGAVLSGGAGADTFVLRAGGGDVRITDFEPGLDSIDLGGWGRIYDTSALTITQTSGGLDITYGTEHLLLTYARDASSSSIGPQPGDILFGF